MVATDHRNALYSKAPCIDPGPGYVRLTVSVRFGSSMTCCRHVRTGACRAAEADLTAHSLSALQQSAQDKGYESSEGC